MAALLGFGGDGQPAHGTANAAERPRARVQRRSDVRLGQAPDGNGIPAATEVLESSTTSNAATRWPTREGCALRWWRSCCERHGTPRWSPGGSKGGGAPLAGGPSMRVASIGRTADTPRRNYSPGRRRESASGQLRRTGGAGAGFPPFNTFFSLSRHGPAGSSPTAGNADRAVLYDFRRLPAGILASGVPPT